MACCYACVYMRVGIALVTGYGYICPQEQYELLFGSGQLGIVSMDHLMHAQELRQCQSKCKTMTYRPVQRCSHDSLPCHDHRAWMNFCPNLKASNFLLHYCLLLMLMVKSQAGKLLASAVTVHSTPRWVSAPLISAHGSTRYSAARSAAALWLLLVLLPAAGGSSDSLESHLNAVSFSTKVPL